MIKRLLLILSIVLLPTVALADQPVLGPATNSTQVEPDSTSGSMLQPASPSQLQSGTDDSNSITAPDTSNLQQTPESTSSLRSLLQGEADTTPDSSSASPVAGDWAWALLILVLLMIAYHYTHIWYLRKKHTHPTRR